MKRYAWFGLLGLLVVLLGACQSNAPATPNVPVVSEGDLETKGFVASADGRLRVIGTSPLIVSLKGMSGAPLAPAGWEFIGPVFDVTAQDRQRRPAQKLVAALRLRFDVPANRPATVLVYTGAAWEIVPSELDADGKLIADVEHLTPYVAAAPTQNQARTSNLTPSPKATVVVTPVPAGDVQTALENAIAPLKGKKPKVTAAAGYTGSLAVALPDWMRASLDVVTATGTVNYGLYNAVNEAVAAQAKGGASVGVLTLVVEPKTAFPANATDARNALATAFPGVPVASLTAVRSEASAYVFYGMSGNTAYSVGYVVHSGVTLAYAMAGSGTYQALVQRQ